MDSKTPSPAASVSLATMLHNATLDKAGKIEFSNTTNVMVPEESSHLLQAIGRLALQLPLTASNEPHNHVPARSSLGLPHELVERILLLLDTNSLLKCRLINREFNGIIQSSILVQYFLACKAAGVIDNSKSPLSYAERLEALKKREDAWRKLEPVFETTIKVNGQPSSLFELTAGNYFRSDNNGKDMIYCHLPSYPQDNPQWFSIPGHGPGKSWSGCIVEMGMAVYEHDLVVNLISSEIANQTDLQRHSLDLVLLKFSTGEYHPLARHPLIHVQRSSSARPYTIIRIVGDNLAFIMDDQDGSKLFIFDWKTGHKRLQHKATAKAYEGSVPVFVSPELLLVPNRSLSRFEVWQLFLPHPNTRAPVQILSLKIPAVSYNYFIIHIRCHGELSPFLHSMPHFPPRPFFPSAEDSIITVSLLLESLLGFPGAYKVYKLVMHRRALLDMIQKWTSHSLLEQQDYPLTWSTNEIAVHRVADPDNGSVRLGVQSELISAMSHPLPGSSPRPCDSPTLTNSQNSPTSHIFTDSRSSSISSSTPSTSRYNLLQVQWADWGPFISRWFQGNESHTWWTHESTGQRYVFWNPHPRDKSKCIVGLADFNLHNVRRIAQLRGGKDEDNGGNGNNGEGKKEGYEEEMEILHHDGVFLEEVYMGLKCAVYFVPGEHDFDAVLMDEERLLGVKFDNENKEESIRVLYFG